MGAFYHYAAGQNIFLFRITLPINIIQRIFDNTATNVTSCLKRHIHMCCWNNIKKTMKSSAALYSWINKTGKNKLYYNILCFFNYMKFFFRTTIYRAYKNIINIT